MCPFGMETFFTLLEILVCVRVRKATSHLTLTATRRDFKMTMELVEWLPTAPAWGNNGTSFINICKTLWYRWLHAALDGSWVIICIKRTSGTVLFSSEVIERCQ